MIHDRNAAFPFLEGARVIIVIGPLELGGAERQALLLARHLVEEQRAKVEVWGYGKPGRAAQLCDEYQIPWRVAPIPIPWSVSRWTQLRALIKFARELRRAKPDVILPFMFFQSVVCGLVWRFTGARVCVWNQRCEGRDRLGRRAEKLAIRLTPRFIANSKHGAEFLVNTLHAPAERVRVVHNGVQLAAPTKSGAEWRRQFGVTDDCFVGCMVANLQTFKDHRTLLRAWRQVVDRLRKDNREAVLLLAGRFDEKYEALKILATELNLGSSVRFLGQVHDIAGVLSAVDLGIHSSVNEGCPNGLLECMSAGLAVTGTNYPGVCEAVGGHNYRFLAPPGDVNALADRIVALSRDVKSRERLGAANRKRIDDEFSPAGMYAETLRVIGEAINGGHIIEPEEPLRPTKVLDNAEAR